MKRQYTQYLIFAVYVFLLILFTVFVFLTEDIFLPAFGLKMPVYILIPLTVSVSMNIRELPSLFYGIFTGALFDMLSSAPDGVYTLIFAVFAFLISVLTKTVFRNSRNVAFLFSILFTLSICVISFTVNFLLSDSSSAFLIIKGFYLPAFLVTTLLSPIFYPVTATIVRIKNERIKN